MLGSTKLHRALGLLPLGRECLCTWLSPAWLSGPNTCITSYKKPPLIAP